MRITPRQYAEGLYEAVKQTDVSVRPGLIDRFLALLSKEKRCRDIPLIFRHIERIAERETGVKSVEIISTKPFSEEAIQIMKSEGKKVFDEEHIFFRQKIQPKLFGGAILRTENETFDASIVGRLGQLKQFLEKSL